MRQDDTIRSGLQACRGGLLIACAFSLALNLLMLTVPLYMLSIYDRVLGSRSEETLLMLSIVAIGAIAAAGVLDGVRQMILNRTGALLETALGGQVLQASLRGAHTGAGMCRAFAIWPRSGNSSHRLWPPRC